jgi:hypothetical protein
VSHKTGNSGFSGVSGKPEPAESAVPCSLLLFVLFQQLFTSTLQGSTLL